MKQVFLTNDNRVVVEQVPAPSCPPNGVLVETRYSLISTGTELNVIRRAAARNLAQTLQARSRLVVKGVRKLLSDGIAKTWRAVEAQYALGEAPGYSLCGRVLEVGAQVDDLSVGDWVACAGSGYAAHAELVAVPKNLTVRLPEGVEARDGAFATVGAIALHGVRQAAPELGELVVVTGLGLIGLLTVRLLHAAGCRVVGIDPLAERRALAESLGALATCAPDAAPGQTVHGLSAGMGADAVLLCAATASNDPLNDAMRMTRKRGRVVVVGDVGLHLEREAFYRNEIDLRIACSYGPGRYDPRYEEGGLDYPFGYVRWTERRNLEAVLDLMASGRLDPRPLVSAITPLDRAAEGFSLLVSGQAVGVLLDYGEPQAPPSAKRIRRVDHLASRPLPGAPKNIVTLALVGAGGFGQSVYLPLIDAHPKARLGAVVTARGHNATRLATRYKARIASTNLHSVLQDDGIDAVIIATRHHLHAEMAIEALKAGKHVLLEKPLAITREQMARLEAVLASTQTLFTVGHNRRYAPCALAARDALAGRSGPLTAHYRINAGRIPPDHWTQDRAIGGGRIIGEVCHFVDLLNWLTGSSPLAVTATAVAPGRGGPTLDNVAATLHYADGSLATILYTSLGSPQLPKERLELFWDGRALVLDDFTHLIAHGFPLRAVQTEGQDKGWAAQLDRFIEALRGGQNRLLTPAEALSACEWTFRIDELARGLRPGEGD